MSWTALLPLLAAAGSSPPDMACRVAVEDIAEDGVIDARNTAIVACLVRATKALHYFDRRSGVVRAREPIMQGTRIGRIVVTPSPAVLPGDRIRITFNLGRIGVTREVSALQSARPGEPFFVRGDDGRVFTAPPLDGER